tara:strand:+ start:174 stop:488 length:315 start_codon:yes stop_codon:yes gene_type:complete
MAFKLNTPPYNQDNTPIYSVDLGNDVLGKANNNGTILVNKDLNPKKIDKVVDHEMVHIDQFKRGDLDYDDKNVYWKGKTYSRSKMQEGAKELPWEKEAYNKTKK